MQLHRPLGGVPCKHWLFASPITTTAAGPIVTATSGAVYGTVTASTKAVVPGAAVTLAGPTLLSGQTVLTDAAGTYRFPAVPPCDYRINVELAGFAKIVREGIRVGGGFTAIVDVVPADIAQALNTLQERNTALASSVRTISHELHPGMLQHSGLQATLQRHCAEIAQHHRIRVTSAAPGDLDALSPDIALCLFRVAQQALANAVRHASAQEIQVRLAASDRRIELAIIDDGVGFIPATRTPRGLGLRSIDERVRLVGGTVKLESRPGHGTRLLVTVPRLNRSRRRLAALHRF